MPSWLPHNPYHLVPGTFIQPRIPYYAVSYHGEHNKPARGILNPVFVCWASAVSCSERSCDMRNISIWAQKSQRVRCCQHFPTRCLASAENKSHTEAWELKVHQAHVIMKAAKGKGNVKTIRCGCTAQLVTESNIGPEGFTISTLLWSLSWMLNVANSNCIAYAPF